MKVVQLDRFGPPSEVARCVDAADVGAPAEDEVVIDVEAFPINPADLLTIKGDYAVRPPLPARLGAEGVGRVRAVGSKVQHLAADDRVINLGRDNWVQRLKVPAAQAVKVPASAEVLQMAMLKVNPATALLMLRNYVDLKPGDWVIQDAANSGVGQNLIRLAKARGLHTVNVVRRPELTGPLAEIGADLVVVDGEDLGARVRAEVGEAEIHLAIDAVAGEACLRLADCLADGGTVVNYGLLSGRPCMLTPHQVVFRGITLTGFWLAKVLSATARDEIQRLYDELAARVADGSLQVPVEATYGIEDIQAALAHAMREGRGGKILVTPNGPVS